MAPDRTVCLRFDMEIHCLNGAVIAPWLEQVASPGTMVLRHHPYGCNGDPAEL
jgi:hypothetical protein